MSATPTMIYVNDVKIETPSEYEYQRYDLDSEDGSGRNQDGTMVRDRVAIKVKLVCKFPPMPLSRASILLNQVSGTSMSVKYFDVYTNGYRTMTAYVGDRTAPFYRWNPDNNEFIVENVSFNFIEM